MSQRTSTFAGLPPQLESTFVPLLAYCAYVFAGASGWKACLAVLAGLVITNGWISSHASDPVYSDPLLLLDVALLALYFLMVDALRRADAEPDRFWFYSAAVFLTYAAWDGVLRRHARDDRRRRRFALYIAVLMVAAPVHVAVGLLARSVPATQAAGIAVWLGVLGLWHFDKWRETRTWEVAR